MLPSVKDIYYINICCKVVKNTQNLANVGYELPFKTEIHHNSTVTTSAGTLYQIHFRKFLLVKMKVIGGGGLDKRKYSLNNLGKQAN